MIVRMLNRNKNFISYIVTHIRQELSSYIIVKKGV